MDGSSKLLGIIASLVASPVKNKLERSETVIKLLKEYNFEPDHPAKDFSGIYAYTLVEYGVGKPKPILNLFRESEIKDALRQAFDNNNFSILLQEGDRFLDWNILGDELRKLEIDPRKEFAAFAAVFIEVVKRSRTPAEVRSDRKIDNLHRQVSELLDKFQRFKDLSEAKIELALQARDYPLLDSVEKTEQEKVDTFILAEQMKAWFETLNYEFDSYENQSDRFFEWIILEETRRGYDRILVRGIEGEVGVADLKSLSQIIEEQNCDEGWLVTSRRISSAAKKASDYKENKHLFCYTFDELIDEKADFSNYFRWLEAEVKHKQIDTPIPL
ncbi:MAG: hypothetical protein AAGE84_29890 [Cyanobacteria bacterium P01_G01_bin.39]